MPTDATTGTVNGRALRWGYHDFGAIAALLAFSTFLGFSALRSRPDVYRSAFDVLFNDKGHGLLVVERLLEGDRLYSEVAFQYGPIPVLLHAAVAGFFGNTLTTFHVLLLVLSLVNVALAYALVRSCSSPLTALLTVGLGLTASMLIPGSHRLLGSFAGITYIPLERSLILVGCLLWTPPLTRTREQALLLGLVIGVWQGVRFGGGVFLGVAVVLADILALWWCARGRDTFVSRYTRIILWTIGAAVMVEVLFAALALLMLPREVAWDVIWPMYVLDTHDAWVTPDLRWPHWGGPRTLVGMYLTSLFGAVAAVTAVAWYLVHRDDRLPDDIRTIHAERIRLLIPFFFFVLGAVGFFRMAYHFYQFAWTLVIPIAWLLHRLDGWKKWPVAAIMLPCFLVSVRAQVSATRDPDLAPFRTPAGEELWASTEARAELASLIEHVSLDDGASPGTSGQDLLLFLPLGAGFHVLYDVDSPIRQSWFMDGFVRSYDEPELIASLDRTRAVVVRGTGPGMRPELPCTWYAPFPLSSQACGQLAARLDTPERIGQFWVFPVRSRSIPAVNKIAE